MIDGTQFVCSNCGSASISRSSIQRGIGGQHWLGLCYECSPSIPALPPKDDHSVRAEKTRRSVEVKTQVKRYRTKLTPLVPASEFKRREKPVEAEPLLMWDDTVL